MLRRILCKGIFAQKGSKNNSAKLDNCNTK